ncbi:hypothetical protein PLESTB_000606300 [Pleodorina starrii]|uniref:Uncharacterized protein n=1 Tax=Pleodorina starrii TaxID=330485 RepID=A0A9W6BIN1_9CHLO|nr:hypothetical protein PLESTB_000606300 [Pleodorina starrii]GLC76082.1 hypothetical protein PLESTF_001732500 [Pleodorina starrii]
MDPSSPAAALAAAMNNPNQFDQILQQQQLQQQQQQQALATGQDGRAGAAAPTAAAAAAGQPVGIDQQRSISLSPNDLANLQQMFAGLTQQAFTELQAHVDARLAQLTAHRRSTRRTRAPAAAAAAETLAAEAADAVEADGAGAEGPSSGSSSEDEGSSDGDDLPPAKGLLNTPPEILVARKNRDLRVTSEREMFVQSWAGKYTTFFSNQQAASMSTGQLVADWRTHVADQDLKASAA